MAFAREVVATEARAIAQVAARIRRNLKDRTDSEALAAYSVLWGLEAAQRRSDEQAENIALLRQDAARLLAPEVPRNTAWLSTLQSAGFLQDGVDEYGIAARARDRRALPQLRLCHHGGVPQSTRPQPLSQ